MMSPPATNSSSTARLPDQTRRTPRQGAGGAPRSRPWRRRRLPCSCRCIEQPGAHGVRNRRGDDRHVLCPLRAVPVANLVGRRRTPIPVRSAVIVALPPETGPLSHRSNRQRRRSAPELRLHLLAAEPDDLPHDPNLLSWCRRLPAGPGRDTPINSARWRHAMSIFALAISSGSSNLAFSSICAKRAAAQGNGSVELLLPEGGGRL